MNTHSNRLSPAYVALAAARGTPELHVQDSMPLGGPLHKVVAAVNNVRDEETLASALADLTDGAARLVPGSTAQRGRIAVFVAQSNRRSHPISNRFQMVSACTAREIATGEIWSVDSDGSGIPRVVQESADDLAAILEERRRHARVVANAHEGAGLALASFGQGDLVRFVDTNTDRASVGCGLVFEVAGELRAVMAGDRVAARSPRLARDAVIEAIPASRVSPHVERLRREVAGTALTESQLEQSIAFLGRCGILSDAMAERMRKLSNTPEPYARAA